jgi:putative zinc finger/helix-turn-helix YgiT family protein
VEHKARHEQQEDARTISPCPMCGSTNVEARTRPERFVYGDGADAVELKAMVPVSRCVGCGFSFSGEAADIARHEAVCAHLGVLAPQEILDIRQEYGLSRAEFARLSGIGDASLSRWENGLLVQNTANDNFLYLLSFPDNLLRLQTRGIQKVRSTHERSRWRLLESEEEIAEVQKYAEAFELQPA